MCVLCLYACIKAQLLVEGALVNGSIVVVVVIVVKAHFHGVVEEGGVLVVGLEVDAANAGAFAHAKDLVAHADLHLAVRVDHYIRKGRLVGLGRVAHDPDNQRLVFPQQLDEQPPVCHPRKFLLDFYLAHHSQRRMMSENNDVRE